MSIASRVLVEVERAALELFGIKPEGLKLGFPPDAEMGDFSIGCFPMAQAFRRSPNDIANLLAEEISLDDTIQEVTAVGPYLNFRIAPVALFGDVCRKVIAMGDAFGNSQAGKGQKVMVEYLSPNTNKPLHLGHLRNGAIGMAVSALLEATGQEVVKANLVNDRGVHICKSMLAWSKWADGATPESTGSKGDHFVGEWYVRYSKEAKADVRLEEEVQTMLQQWEAGDLEIVELWRTMNDWVYAGFGETYEWFGLEFDTFYYESNTYKLGKDIIEAGLESGVIFRNDEGACVLTLPEEFGRDQHGALKQSTLLRADGTSVYMTQDLGTAKIKFDEYGLTHSIYVVGNEQNHHFRSLFAILEMLGYEWAKDCFHLSYGMVYLPEGKMKSREGKVIDADDLMQRMERLAGVEIRARDKVSLPAEEVGLRARVIGLGAIKFHLLQVDPGSDIHFDPEKSISFEGRTGPYCQYAYARICGIVRNALDSGITSDAGVDFSSLGNPEERVLIRQLIQFPDEVASAARDLNPVRIANFVYGLARAFNQFYHKHSVLDAGDEGTTKARLALVSSVATVIKNGLALLGIGVLQEM
ncbi:arginine--tRNA ligase [Candidatus Falkowbacteria bacterium]|nr:arginine--tRNA ligase [Candidatus Falkowbacteria bacterium]